MHADDVLIAALAVYLQSIPGLEDHVTLDEADIPEEIDLPWAWLQLGDFNIASRTLEGKKHRSLEVHIDLITRNRRGQMEQANTLAAVIENRIDADPTLGRRVASAQLLSGTRERDDTASMARLRLIYSIEYSTAAGAATTPLP